MTNKRFNEMLKEQRLLKKLTLREFCRIGGEDPANLSRIERGLRPAPQDEVIERYAKVLELAGDELRTFKDMAALSRRELPKDIPESALYEKLPALLRAIERRPSEEQLQEAISITKKAFRVS
ncbi:MAG: helix-turn-helix transcriptional regulator [Victivallaceae bacterium]|nr:helix-turn-helix transcriptional regulator [Victivallaceae bacterium]MDD4180846.1 helix-turn-helix transcriptional regulator [Victivallaceae bacterium]